MCNARPIVQRVARCYVVWWRGVPESLDTRYGRPTLTISVLIEQGESLLEFSNLLLGQLISHGGVLL